MNNELTARTPGLPTRFLLIRILAENLPSLGHLWLDYDLPISSQLALGEPYPMDANGYVEIGGG